MAVTRQLQRILNKHARMEEHSIRFDEGLEMTPKEMRTIQAIGAQQQINVTGVAVYLGITKSAASQRITRLVEKGFVEKDSAAPTHKQLRLSLTASGWRAVHAHQRLHEKYMADLVHRLGAFTRSQLGSTSAALEAIYRTVEDRFA